MLEFQQRVVTERGDLDDKIQKLSKFLDTNTFYNLHLAEQRRLENQLTHMNAYREVLDERIAAF